MAYCQEIEAVVQSLRIWMRHRTSWRDALVDPRPWPRALSVAALCLAIGVPVGAIVGLLGGLYGTAFIIALVLGYLMLRSLIVGLMALIGVVFLLPFAALPVHIGVTPTLLNLVLATLFFVWASRVAAHKDRAFQALAPTFGVLIFVLLALFSFISGLGHASLTANVIRHFVEILLSILTFVLVINAVRGVPQLRFLTGAIILAGSAAALVGILLYALPEEMTVRALSSLRVVGYPSGSDVLRYIEDDPSRALRATSTSIDPNVLGGALIFATTIATTQIFSPAPVWPKRWLALMAASMALCLFLTFSRGSLMGLTAAVLLLALLRYRRALIIALAALALLLLLPPAQVYVEHFMSGIRGEDLATQMRFGEYKDALILIRRYPWFGVGFSGTPDVDTYLGVSNVYLLIAENMGLVGLGAFLANLFIYLHKVITTLLSRQTRARVSVTSLGFFLAIVGAMVGGMFDHYLFNLVFPHASTILWLTMGLGVISLHLDMTTPGSVDQTSGVPLKQQIDMASGQ